MRRSARLSLLAAVVTVTGSGVLLGVERAGSSSPTPKQAAAGVRASLRAEHERAMRAYAASRAAHSTRSASDTPVTSFDVSALPACIPVADKSGKTRGCIDKHFVYGNDGAWEPVPTGLPGYPIKASANDGTIVGYSIGRWGFVDAATALDPAKVKTLLGCYAQIIDEGAVTFSQTCIDAFAAQGYQLPSTAVAKP